MTTYTYERGFGGAGVLRSAPTKDYPLGRPEGIFASYEVGKRILDSLISGNAKLEHKEGNDD